MKVDRTGSAARRSFSARLPLRAGHLHRIKLNSHLEYIDGYAVSPGLGVPMSPKLSYNNVTIKW